LTSKSLQALPQGANANVNQIVLQSPGIWQESFSQIHIRGEHGNVQYRIDGVQFPQGLSFFGQALESRFANSASVLTGSLPAQYGINAAGVIDIQTKTGFTSPGLSLSMYGGSWGWLQPSFEEGGHSGPIDWFIGGDYLHNDRGIDNPAPTYGALHDTTNQFHGFAHVSGILDENTRLSLLVGAYSGQFQIPNIEGKPTTPGLSVRQGKDLWRRTVRELLRVDRGRSMQTSAGQRRRQPELAPPSSISRPTNSPISTPIGFVSITTRLVRFGWHRLQGQSRHRPSDPAIGGRSVGQWSAREHSDGTERNDASWIRCGQSVRGAKAQAWSWHWDRMSSRRAERGGFGLPDPQWHRREGRCVPIRAAPHDPGGCHAPLLIGWCCP
jgi:hypothetical protein